MSDRVPIVDGEFELQQFSGKGGWTYVCFPGLTQEKHHVSGTLKISGNIDAYEVSNQSLLPMGKGRLMLTVNAAIRKEIKKQAGDIVYIRLYREVAALDVDNDFIECLKDEAEAYKQYEKLSASEKEDLLNWIKAAKGENGKIERIALVVNSFVFNRKLLFSEAANDGG